MADLDVKAFTRMVQPIALANRDYSKIFGIGANKTGTTTLEGILRLYGFDVANQQRQEILLTKQTLRGNYEPFKRFVEAHDAFQDQPFSRVNVYIAADCLFPNSKFILTERDPELWFDSVCRHVKRGTGLADLTSLTPDDLMKFTYLYPGYRKEGFEQLYVTFEEGEPKLRLDLIFDRDYQIEAYKRRNEEIKRYFYGRPESLLCIDFAQEQATDRICAFLNIPSRFAIATPHLNRGG